MTNEEIKTLVINFYKDIDEDTCSLFDLNMKNAILDSEGNLKPYISERTFGLALYSVFNAVKKTRELEAKRKLAELNKCDEYFGEVGYKFKGHPLKVTLVKVGGFETQFGYTYIWTMKDKEGHEFVWFASSSPLGHVEQKAHEIKWNDDLDEETKQKELGKLTAVYKAIENGSPVSFNLVSGSIKAHQEYKNRLGVVTKQTVVTRCKIEDMEAI